MRKKVKKDSMNMVNFMTNTKDMTRNMERMVIFQNLKNMEKKEDSEKEAKNPEAMDVEVMDTRDMVMVVIVTVDMGMEDMEGMVVMEMVDRDTEVIKGVIPTIMYVVEDQLLYIMVVKVLTQLTTK